MTQQDLLAAASNPPRELSQEDYAAYLAHLYGQWEDAGSQGAGEDGGEDGGEKESGKKPGEKAEASSSEQDPRP